MELRAFLTTRDLVKVAKLAVCARAAVRGTRRLSGALPIATDLSRRLSLLPAGMRKPVVRVAGGERAEKHDAPHAFLCA